jgi:hypothetical protein
MVASYHALEISNHEEWIATAQAMSDAHDFSVVLVAFPRDLHRLQEDANRLRSAGLEVFVQPFIGLWEGKMYPESYSSSDREFLKGQMYSRHDVEFLLNLKQPGLCNAGYKSLYVGPMGDVFPCGMGSYETSLGNLATTHELKLASGPEQCMFQRCQCDTENMNTTIFEKNYKFDAINQHKYQYRFKEQAATKPELDEWTIKY